MYTYRLKTYTYAYSLREGLLIIGPIFVYIGLGRSGGVK